MNVRLAVAASVVAFSLTACAPAEDAGEGEGTWIGTITTEGNVTTVINESGSVWGGTATLVEEVSIGVDVGDDPYMFGGVSGIWATDERIYVADYGIPAVRVYDLDGGYLMDIGGRGEGPGEYTSPNSVVVGVDGRIHVKEGRPGGRINVYGEDGASVATLYGDRLLGSAWPLVPTRDGSVYTPTRADFQAEPGNFGLGMSIPGPDGIVGDPIVVPMLGYSFEGVAVRSSSFNIPFSPHHTWAMSPSGAIVAGVTDAYRFEMHTPDGHVTVVEKAFEPIPVDAAEADWQRRSTIRFARRFEEDWTWDGAEIPGVKPPWSGLYADAGGRVWIARRGASRRIDDCDENPLDVESGRPRSCWASDLSYEVFGEDGRFLGGVAVPAGVTTLLGAYIRDEVFIARLEDDAGTIMVKRYRLVLPVVSPQ